MKIRTITTAFAAAALGSGLIAAAAAPASADEQVCYADETHTELAYELQRSDWVAGTPETPAVAPSIDGNWYTEGDDAAPVATDGGLVFTGPGDGRAVGVRAEDNRALDGYEIPISASGDYFHVRLVLDVVGSPFGNWRDDYLSATQLDDGSFYIGALGDSLTTDEILAAYPGVWVTSVGYHLDSNAPAGTTAVVTGAPFVAGTPAIPGTPDSYTEWYVVSEGQGVELPDGRADGEEFQTDALHRYVVTGEVEVTEQVETECPVVTPEPSEEPTASTEPTPSATPTPAAAATEVEELAETGFDAMWLPYAAAGLVVAGLATVVIRRRAAKHNG